ncbi:MAG: phosphoribosylanthranilate isomerase [Planctomycetaceae bacterium]|nr:phosphoribosylanthranilate isomerase [Planctomycetaceae bacterium]
MIRVKICGNTSEEQVRLCAEAGADCVGFVVEYPVDVPWNLSRERAHELLRLVPPMVARAVVTGGDPDRVVALARQLSPHLIQLHTDNTLSETATIVRKLASLGIGLIRALRIDVATQKACGEISDPVKAALGIQDTGVAGVLVDARTDRMPAGTGLSVDWQIASEIRQALSTPMMLAGGLTPENVRNAVERVLPFAVDVITGVETSRTVKSPERVREFVRQARASFI